MINEFDEEILEEEIKEIAERISKLSDKDVDELWFRCDLIYAKPKAAAISKGKNKDFKAIPDDALKELRKNNEESESLLTLLGESHIKDVLKNLEEIEDE